MSHKPFLITDNIHNFRDYGGYRVINGGVVKSSTLFRSGHHANASKDDLRIVGAIDFAHIIDLRGNSERQAHTCIRASNFKGETLFFDGETAGLTLAPHLEAANSSFDAVSAHQAMVNLYASLPDRLGLTWILKRFFRALSEGMGPSLVHCAAGKDRTGMAVDLLHHILGVHPDDAMEDYLLTNSSPRNEERIKHGMALMGQKYGTIEDDVVRVLMGVDMEFLLAARNSVKERFGSVDIYLEKILGVDSEVREKLVAGLVVA